MKVKVTDITCKHCVMKIEKTLLMDNLKAKVSLEDKSVTFSNEADQEKIILSIKKAGYTPQV